MTPTWAGVGSVDVSGLSNGTVYTILIQLKVTANDGFLASVSLEGK